MSNVIRFPEPKRVIIYCHTVTETRVVGAGGTRIIRHEPGQLRFFIDIYDGGGRAGVWDGDSYTDALRAAWEWCADGYAIDDKVAAEGRT